MKLLITGATGLIGSELTSICEAQGIEVNYLTTRKQKIVKEEHAKGFYWNPNQLEMDPEALRGVDAIINLAGATIAKRWTPARKRKIMDSRVNALRTLGKALDEHPNTVAHVVTASAIGIYPSSPSEYYTEKETKSDPLFLGEVLRKVEKEAFALKRPERKVSIIRIGLVLSADGGALAPIAKTVKYGLGAAFGTGQQWQSWIHIEDVARVFLFLVEEGLSGVFNAVAPNPVVQQKLVKQVAKTMDRPLFLPNIPDWMLHLGLGEMSRVLLDSHRVSSQKLEKHGFVFQHANLCTAVDQLLG